MDGTAARPGRLGIEPVTARHRVPRREARVEGDRAPEGVLGSGPSLQDLVESGVSMTQPA
ncbi:hypothetical protein OG819_43330 [Streptomyces sp. NBC_01549]|uniref:hypothetical protein n=1 Tax=Streptomyces sp. NBC_01549 TaxID=2975874 RepID=UPI002255EE86|nr:hypothetical protein [Streptomyces sp. NBC_01549]MCX4596249.1 hypothetical protein [Streptomyces sp. NBC_01549]